MKVEPMIWPLPEKILSWVETAAPGERLTYFTGFLATTPEASAIGQAALQLRESGAVVLFQKRCSPEAFDCIAERRRT